MKSDQELFGLDKLKGRKLKFGETGNEESDVEENTLDAQPVPAPTNGVTPLPSPVDKKALDINGNDTPQPSQEATSDLAPAVQATTTTLPKEATPVDPKPIGQVGHDGMANGLNREQWRDKWMASGVKDIEGLKRFLAENGGNLQSDNGQAMTPFGESLDLLANARTGNGTPAWTVTDGGPAGGDSQGLDDIIASQGGDVGGLGGYEIPDYEPFAIPEVTPIDNGDGTYTPLGGGPIGRGTAGGGEVGANGGLGYGPSAGDDHAPLPTGGDGADMPFGGDPGPVKQPPIPIGGGDAHVPLPTGGANGGVAGPVKQPPIGPDGKVTSDPSSSSDDLATLIANDPAIAANRRSLSRDYGNMRAQAAEQAAVGGQAGSGAFAGKTRQLAEDEAEAAGQFAGGRASDIKREAQQDDQFAKSLGLSYDQLKQQEAQYAKSLGFNYAQMSQQDKQFMQSQMQQDAQFAKSLGFNYAQLSQQQRQFVQSQSQAQNQFTQSLGFNYNQLNQQQKQFLTSINQNKDQFLKSLGLSYAQLSAQQKLSMQQLAQQNDQFLKSLGFNYDQFEADQNNKAAGV